MISVGSQSANRTKKIKKNIISMFLIRGISIGITYLYVPLLLDALDKVEYGIWLTLTSIAAWITMFDVGLGNGLRNKLSAVLARGDKRRGQELVSTGYIAIFLMAILFMVLFSIVFPNVSWTEVLNAPADTANIINPLVFVVVIAFCTQFALSLITSVLYALQLPAFSSFTLMAGQLISFITVTIEYKILGITSLLILGSSVAVTPLVAMTGVSLYVFVFRYPYLRPKLRLFGIRHVKSIFNLGIQFFLLQIITIILFHANNLIITHTVGSAAVVTYNIAFKLMHSIVLVFSIVVTPIWSAATEAYTLGDFDWLKDINKKLMKIVGLLSVGGLALLCLSPWIYDIWLGKDELEISISTSALLLAQSVFFILYSSHGYLLNGMGKLRIQMILTSIMAVLYVPLAVYVGDRFGLNGIIAVFALNSLLNSVWSSWQFHLVVNHKASGIWNK